MEADTKPTYNQVMPASRHTNGLLAIISLAVIGYLLFTLPPRVIEHYETAAKLGTWPGYLYLAAVGTGALVIFGLAVGILVRVWKNTRTKSIETRRRNLSPSEMSSGERTRELGDNLAEGKEYASGEGVSPKLRAEIEAAVAELEAKRQQQRLEIVAFGTISSGKSSLLNALAGRDVFRSNVVGGTTVTRSEIPWPAGDSIVLVDTPGLAEVRGESRAAEAAGAAKNADLVLFVVDGPLKEYERDLLAVLAKMEKRIVVCLNKEDWYDDRQRAELLGQIAEQVTPMVKAADVVSVRSQPVSRRRVKVLADGTEEEDSATEPADISPLARRMMAIVERDGRELLLANLLLQSRGLVDESKARVLAALDERADALIAKYMWAAGGATAINPIPLLDLAGGSAITVKMVLDLAGIYQQKIDADTVVTLLGQLGKNLLAMVGATAATPAVAAGIASLMKTVPGIGTIAGGILQGLVQALVTRWIGRVFSEYFKNEMQPPAGGLAELARREWAEVTTPEQLKKLIQWGRERLDSH
jgi:small GTP-binding protein